MKTRRSVFGPILILAAFLALVIWAGAFPPVSVSATPPSGPYDYTVTRYRLEYDLSADRVLTAKEEITAYFTGYDSHGIIRDFPLESGVRYENIQAKCDNADFSPYLDTESGDFGNYLSLYLRGEKRVTGETRTYTVTYRMILPELSQKGYVPLDLVGFSHDNDIFDLSVTVTYPAGLTDYTVYSGRSGTKDNDYISVKQTENGMILTAESLPYDCGVTLDLLFDGGVLSKSFNWSVLIAVITACVIIVAAILIKRFFFRDPLLTCPVNFTAPDEMDPLLMGKLIDNTVDGEDMGSLVFWLADQGYLTIDISEGEHNPILRPTGKSLGAGVPVYGKEFFNGLFDSSDEVRVSDLTHFYKTAEAVKAQLSARVEEEGGVYKSKTALGAVLTIFFALLSAGVLWLYSFLVLSPSLGYFYIAPFIFCLLAAAAGFAPAKIIEMRRYKWKKRTILLVALASLALGSLISFFSLIVRGAVTGALPNLFAAYGSFFAGFLCGLMAKRTDEYVKKIGAILGFKNFITTTERERIQVMLQENPELYYHILPYAQVLGVSDEWTDRFSGLNMEPPTYFTCGDMMFDYLIFRHAFVNFDSVFAQKITPPGKGGGFGGGGGGSFGGGFGGGGFGGGGMRGC